MCGSKLGKVLLVRFPPCRVPRFNLGDLGCSVMRCAAATVGRLSEQVIEEFSEHGGTAAAAQGDPGFH
jgi:hypothetical protein